MSSQDSDRFREGDGYPRLRYRDEGSGPAVLLVHGWLLDLTMWDALAAALIPRFRVIRWDRRGFGESAGTPNLAVDAADGLRLLDDLGVHRSAILGISQGCRIALSIVEKAPDRSACLILDGAPPLDGLPDRQWQDETPVFKYRAILLEQGIETLRAHLATHPLLQLHTSDHEPQARMNAMLARYEGADLLALTSGPPPPPPADRFKRLTLPVLVLNGEFDSAQRLRIGETLCECITGAERQVVPNSRHMACWDNPQAYKQFVSNFLTANVNRWA